MYLTPEDNYIMLRHTCSVPLYQMERDDETDYRAMLAREEARQEGRAPGASCRRPGQWVNMAEALRAEAS